MFCTGFLLRIEQIGKSPPILIILKNHKGRIGKICQVLPSEYLSARKEKIWLRTLKYQPHDLRGLAAIPTPENRDCRLEMDCISYWAWDLSMAVSSTLQPENRLNRQLLQSDTLFKAFLGIFPVFLLVDGSETRLDCRENLSKMPKNLLEQSNATNFTGFSQNAKKIAN
jgi:hypothetical protein